MKITLPTTTCGSEYPRKLIKTQIWGTCLQHLRFSSFGVDSKILHFPKFSDGGDAPTQGTTLQK